MVDDIFDRQKQSTLDGIDNSKKGSFDKPIHELMVFINSLQNFFTTSSCSGRIIVFTEGDEKKKGCKWLLTSHVVVEASDVIEALQTEEHNKLIMLKYESFILHLQCRTVEDAQEILKIALGSGYRNSGIVIGKKKKYMVAVRSTHGLEVPLVFDSSISVSDEYIGDLVALANNKLIDNFSRVEKFFENIKKAFSTS